MIFNAKRYNRPLLIYGYGVRLAGAESGAVELAERSGIPVALTWGAIDLMPTSHPLNVGGFGTHGNRAPNFAVQNADLIIAVGTRLDSKSTGTPVESFARQARIVMVDIDQAELDKFFKFERVERVHEEAKEFLSDVIIETGDYSQWLTQIDRWKSRYPVCKDLPYRYVEQLSDLLPEGAIIVSDTGHTLAWMMQGFKFKKGQRFIHAMNNTPMGYGLPAAIGASFANPGKPITLVTGDGGLQLNIQEMATVIHHNLPIRIILFNNQGHGMCRQSQEQWLGSRFASTCKDGGLACPRFTDIARAYGFVTPTNLRLATTWAGPLFYELQIPFDAKLTPQVRFGHPNEDADPLLDREELSENMLIPLWK